MKTKTFLIGALVVMAGAISLLAQGTAFTYQGQLNDKGAPANGNYDLQFMVFSDSELLGATTNAHTPVTNGLFTVTLDLGGEPFNHAGGLARWLEIGVRPGGSGDAFTILSPRQQITAAPYAIRAANAEVAGVAASVAAGGIGASQLAPGAVGAAQLAPGAAAANLSASGHGAVPSGGLILSMKASDSSLVEAGYVRIGAQMEVGERWESMNAPNPPSGAFGASGSCR